MKKELTTVEKIVLAGLSIVGIGNVDEAYSLLHKSKSSPEIVHRMALRWARQPSAKKYISDQRAILENRVRKTKDQDSLNDLTKRDNLLLELQIQYRVATTPKEKSDILGRIADITKMKSYDERAQEEERVHYYLPRLECENCPYSHSQEESE